MVTKHAGALKEAGIHLGQGTEKAYKLVEVAWAVAKSHAFNIQGRSTVTELWEEEHILRVHLRC